MKLFRVFATCWLVLALPRPSDAQTYDTNNEVVETFAGSGFSGYLDGVGQQTMFDNPSMVVADSSGNLFVWDSSNSRIREIAPNGTVSTFAGTGSSPNREPPLNFGFLGYGTNVSLPGFSAMTIDHSNVLWMAFNYYGVELYRIGPDARVSVTNVVGPGEAGGICVDSGNNIYLADTEGEQIYRYTTNGISGVFAGSGNIGSLNGNGLFCSFDLPSALAADAADNIYVWDSQNALIRRIDQSSNVVTIAGGSPSTSDGQGTNTGFGSVYAMCVDDSGNLILGCGSCIRKITPTTNVVTMAGSFTQPGYTNGVGALARFSGANDAQGICVSQGLISVADTGNQRIRQISFNPASQPVSGINLVLSLYPGLQITGMVGRTYQIQSSPDMQTWTLSATLLLSSSPYLWFDTNSSTANKFYRAFLLP